MSSDLRNCRKFGFPPVMSHPGGSGLPYGSLVTRVGVRSRRRLATGIAMTIISGMAYVPPTPVDSIWSTPVTEWKCTSPSSR
jgi:hypothetical protein